MEKWSNSGPEKKKIQDESTTNILQNHQGNANIYISIYTYKYYIYIYIYIWKNTKELLVAKTTTV